MPIHVETLSLVHNFLPSLLSVLHAPSFTTDMIVFKLFLLVTLLAIFSSALGAPPTRSIEAEALEWLQGQLRQKNLYGMLPTQYHETNVKWQEFLRTKGVAMIEEH